MKLIPCPAFPRFRVLEVLREYGSGDAKPHEPATGQTRELVKDHPGFQQGQVKYRHWKWHKEDTSSGNCQSLRFQRAGALLGLSFETAITSGTLGVP